MQIILHTQVPLLHQPGGLWGGDGEALSAEDWHWRRLQRAAHRAQEAQQL